MVACGGSEKAPRWEIRWRRTSVFVDSRLELGCPG
jgi:hypothetical protein